MCCEILILCPSKNYKIFVEFYGTVSNPRVFLPLLIWIGFAKWKMWMDECGHSFNILRFYVDRISCLFFHLVLKLITWIYWLYWGHNQILIVYGLQIFFLFKFRKRLCLSPISFRNGPLRVEKMVIKFTSG